MSSLIRPPWLTINTSPAILGSISASSKLLLRPELTLEMLDSLCSKMGDKDTLGQPCCKVWGPRICDRISESNTGVNKCMAVSSNELFMLLPGPGEVLVGLGSTGDNGPRCSRLSAPVLEYPEVEDVEPELEWLSSFWESIGSRVRSLESDSGGDSLTANTSELDVEQKLAVWRRRLILPATASLSSSLLSAFSWAHRSSKNSTALFRNWKTMYKIINIKL